jgi:hypothetical protein
LAFPVSVLFVPVPTEVAEVLAFRVAVTVVVAEIRPAPDRVLYPPPTGSDVAGGSMTPPKDWWTCAVDVAPPPKVVMASARVFALKEPDGLVDTVSANAFVWHFTVTVMSTRCSGLGIGTLVPAL